MVVPLDESKGPLRWLQDRDVGWGGGGGNRHVPEFIDTIFVKTSPKHSFSIVENQRFVLVYAKTGSINLGNRYK